VECKLLRDVLKGDDCVEIRVSFKDFLRDEIQSDEN
jgi:hypothetical protein